MRTLCLIAASALASACAATSETAGAQPAATAGDRRPSRTGDPEAHAIARDLYSQLARQMLERPNRIMEAEARRQGLGGMLVGYDLYEEPQASAFPGLCEVTVRQIAVAPTVPAGGTEPPPQARSEQSISRFYAIGSTLPQASGDDGRDRCAALVTARNFFDAPSARFADEAVRTFEFGQLWSRTAHAAVSLRCRIAAGPCPAPAGFFQALSVQRLRSVAEAQCPADLPGRGETCFVYQVDETAGPAGGSWIVTIRGPQRPLEVDIRPAPVVVT